MNTPLTLIGLKLGYKTTNKNEKAMEDCGALWQEYMGGFVPNKIPNKLNGDTYAVYFDYDGDHTDPYSYFIGCPVEDGTEVPTGLDSIIIPLQKYEMVTAKGKMPDCVAEAWCDIWQRDIDRAYGYDFEIYRGNMDWNNAEVEIYLSVK
ncbi:GyrI-like domain-containing protein [Flavobacterium sp.]|uniref:GyrI-like domain-containing protein n=1 Tax=Flavobacterium sp. TaxID=239 RepID=UPI004033524F